MAEPVIHVNCIVWHNHCVSFLYLTIKKNDINQLEIRFRFTILEALVQIWLVALGICDRQTGR